MKLIHIMGKLVQCVTLLLYVSSVSTLLCGKPGSLVKYNPNTDTCVDGIVKPRIPNGPEHSNTETFKAGQLLCGSGSKMSPYNLKDQICCNYTLYPSDGNTSCCYNTPYNKYTQICCGNIPRPKPELDITVTCCGNDPQTEKNSLCCGGILYKNKNPDQFDCCGSKPYEFRKDVCCEDTVHAMSEDEECCKSQTYNRSLQYCYNHQDILNLDQSKCLGDIYDTTVFICCGGNLHPFAKGVECCGSETFNKKSQDCADKNVVPKSYRWCNPSGNYNPKNQTCCKGKIKKKSGPSWGCCGSEVIDHKVNGCCAGKTFDKRNQNCCGGNVTKIEEMCCARRVLDRNTEVCCGKTLFEEEKIVSKSEPYHDKCCPNSNGGTSYDSINFDCTFENKVVKKTNRRTLCGGDEYNPSDDLCCNSKVFKNASRNGMSCCNPSASIYNPKTHECCDGKRKRLIRFKVICSRGCFRGKMTVRRLCRILKGKSKNFQYVDSRRRIRHSCKCEIKRRKTTDCESRSRVIGEYFIRNTCLYQSVTGSNQESACQIRNNLHELNLNVQCCPDQNKIYNPHSHICCGGNLHPRIVNGSVLDCCGEELYNVRKSLCCNEVFHPSRNPDQYGCCNSAVFDYTKKMCCGSKLHKLEYSKFCCGNETYDPYEEYCFQNKELLDLWVGKCGGHKYDTRQSICCNETIIKGTYQDQRCCGSSSFNMFLQSCVDNRVVRKGYRWCSNYGEYNLETHDCCEGQLKERKSSSWRCCGKEMIDYKMNTCCAGKPFDKKIQTCCEGKVIKKDRCCAGQLLDKDTHVCCGKTLFREENVLKKKEAYHDKCCPTLSGGTSYDSSAFVCTFENKVVKNTNIKKLCGRDEYNQSEDLCCNYKLFKNASRDGMSCCLPSASIYNPKTHVCCFGVRKKGKRCIRPRYRLRCPRVCRSRKITLRKFCKKSGVGNTSYEAIENIKKQMSLLLTSKSCGCVYKEKRRKRLCKGEVCRTFKRLVGILVEHKQGYRKIYLRKKMKNSGRHVCNSLTYTLGGDF